MYLPHSESETFVKDSHGAGCRIPCLHKHEPKKRFKFPCCFFVLIWRKTFFQKKERKKKTLKGNASISITQIDIFSTPYHPLACFKHFNLIKTKPGIFPFAIASKNGRKLCIGNFFRCEVKKFYRKPKVFLRKSCRSL